MDTERRSEVVLFHPSLPSWINYSEYQLQYWDYTKNAQNSAKMQQMIQFAQSKEVLWNVSWNQIGSGLLGMMIMEGKNLQFQYWALQAGSLVPSLPYRIPDGFIFDDVLDFSFIDGDFRVGLVSSSSITAWRCNVER